MENSSNKDLAKEIQRRKSAATIPQKSNISQLTDHTSTISTNSPLQFKSNSLFAYQEIDKYSSFCDKETYPLEKILTFLNNKNDNQSSNQDDYEESDSSGESFDDKISDDDIVFEKFKHRLEKRSSAFNTIPLYFSLKSIDGSNNNTNINNNNNSINSYNNSGNKNGISNKDVKRINNNFLLSKDNNYLRRNSHQINQFQNPLLFNSQQNLNSYNFNKINFTNKINNNNCYMQNNNSRIGYYPFGFSANNMSSIILQQNNFLQRRYSNNSMNLNIGYNLLNQKNILNNNENNQKKVELKEEDPNYFLKDQLYCRQIQAKLESNVNNNNYSYEFYENIKNQLIEIIEHQFGNYVIQKFLSNLIIQENKKIFTQIFLDIKEKLYDICVHNYGTRVIQKTLEKLDNGNYIKIETDSLDEIIQNLISNHLYDLCCDKNGNHVYQKLLRIFPKEKNNFFFENLIKISYPVSIIQQGATLLQNTFDYSNKEQQEKLSMSIAENIDKLINDKYGNYTLQTLIKLNNKKLTEKIYDFIQKNLLQLSKEKFSSNVIDKCIVKDNINSNNLIKTMIESNIIKDIITDQYGNYVVQKALAISDKEICEKIIKQIKPIINDLQKTNIGKKIYEKLVANYGEYLV